MGSAASVTVWWKSIQNSCFCTNFAYCKTIIMSNSMDWTPYTFMLMFTLGTTNYCKIRK